MKTDLATHGKPKALGPLEFAVLALFFFSGASALVYEVVWTRDLTNVFGGSAFAIATVLAAFMAGLALGSKLFGSGIDRRGHPLVVYGVLEAGIAVWALILPALLGLLDHAYAAFYRSADPGFYTLSLVRFVLTFVVLLIPTTMMGGTLPVLGKLLLRDQKGLGTRAGLLYGINTLGAVVGVAGGGFFLLPALGLHGSTMLAVGINLAVAAVAVLLARRPEFSRRQLAAPAETPGSPAKAQATSALRRAVLVVYAASGFAALAYEVAWTKTLSMILGTTTYAFTSMLTTFLLGLALGSFLFARLADRYGRPEALLAWVQTAIPLLALMTIPILERLPQMFVDGFPTMSSSWAMLEFYKVLLAALTMFLPTVLMGGTFPLVTRVFVTRGATGSNLGTLYAANTIGAILGSFLAGFVLVPLVGRQHTILAATFVNLVAVMYLLGALSWRRVPTTIRAALAVTLLLMIPGWVLGMRPWDQRIMASGAYIYAHNMSKFDSILEVMQENKLIFYDEATEATVSVWQGEQVTSLRTNGKVEASSHGDMITQKLISHLPGIYHAGEPRSGLMIGLASGISVGAMLTHPFQTVETVELMPSMEQAARYFDHYNRHCLDDPRHTLVLNDGRNHLLLADKQYDIIISEPSNPWISGVGALFTQEFFQLTKDRLKPGGVVCQWVQTYQMQAEDLRTVLGTFLDAYGDVHLWQAAPGDLVVVAAEEKLQIDVDALRAALDGPVGDDLRDLEILPVGQLLSAFITDRAGVERFVGDWPKRVTDDNLYLEFAMPRNMYRTEGLVNALTFEPVQTSVVPYLRTASGSGIDPALVRDIDDYRFAHAVALRVFFGQPLPAGATDEIQALEMALARAPREVLSRHLLSRKLNEAGNNALLAGNVSAALPVFHRTSAIGSPEERALALNNLGTIHFQSGNLDSARVYWERCVAQEPNYPTPNYNLAVLAAREGRYREAVPYLTATVAFDPQNASAWNNLAYYTVLSGGDLDEAETAVRRALALDPENNVFRDTLGFVLLKQGNWKQAEAELSRVVQRDPSAHESRLHLGMARAALGNADGARADFETVVNRAQDAELVRRAREELQKL